MDMPSQKRGWDSLADWGATSPDFGLSWFSSIGLTTSYINLCCNILYPYYVNKYSIPYHSLSFALYTRTEAKALYVLNSFSPIVWAQCDLRLGYVEGTGTLHVACTTMEHGVQNTNISRTWTCICTARCTEYIVGRSQPPVGLFFSVCDCALLQEKKTKIGIFKVNARVLFAWGLFLFFFLKASCKGTSCCVSTTYVNAWQVEFFVPVAESTRHVSPPFLPYRSSLSPCWRGENCVGELIGYYDVQHICPRQPRWSSFTLWLCYPL